MMTAQPIGSASLTKRTERLRQQPEPAAVPVELREQADRCQALWRAVLMLALREDGEAYLLTPDGRAVCEMAGVDPARFRPAALRAAPKRSKAGRHRGAPRARSALHWTREQDAAFVAMKAAGASSKAIAAAVGRPVPSVWSRTHYLGLRQARV